MVAGDFARNFSALAGGLSARAFGDERAAEPARPAQQAGLGAARYSRAGLSSVVASVPVGYAFDSGPDRPLSIDGVLQYADTEGAKTYGANLGLAYRARVDERWYLVPSASLGLTASSDLGTAGEIASAALTSAFRLYENADYALWLGNAVNLQRTLRVSVSGYSFDPKLHNAVFKNGLLLSAAPSPLLGNY